MDRLFHQTKTLISMEFHLLLLVLEKKILFSVINLPPKVRCSAWKEQRIIKTHEKRERGTLKSTHLYRDSDPIENYSKS